MRSGGYGTLDPTAFAHSSGKMNHPIRRTLQVVGSLSMWTAILTLGVILVTMLMMGVMTTTMGWVAWALGAFNLFFMVYEVIGARRGRCGPPQRR